MTDVILVVVLLAFFAISAGYVAVCDRLGRDEGDGR